MKTIISAILLAILFPSGTSAMSKMPKEQKQLIAAEKAGEAALAGYNSRAWAFPPAYAQAMKSARAGIPLLVERLDREATFYYIVPFKQNDKTTLLVMVDAHTGAFKEAVPLSEPMNYPPLTAEAASKILAAHLEGDGTAIEIADSHPNLVWKPSEQSQTPFEPLWRFRTSRGDRYVDQTGNVHRSIEQPHFKGG